jgi:hypothetical protein
MLARVTPHKKRMYDYEVQGQERVLGVDRPVLFLQRKLRQPSSPALATTSDVFEVGLQVLLGAGAITLRPERWPALCGRTSRARAAPERFAEFRDAVAGVLGCSGEEAATLFDDYRRRLHERRLTVIQEGRNRHPLTFRFAGKDRLDRSLADGKGAILWASPFAFQSVVGKRGLWEAGIHAHQMSVAEHGFSYTRFGIRFLNGPAIAAENRYLASRIVFERDEVLGAVRRALKIVKQGGVLIFTNNVHSGRALVDVPLKEGGYIEMAQTPLSMAQKHGIPLHVMTTIETVPFRDYDILISDDLNEVPTDAAVELSAERRMAEMAVRVRDEMLAAARQAPDQFMGWNAIHFQSRLT